MNMQQFKDNLYIVLEDASLRQGLSEFLNKFTYKGFGTIYYELADVTRCANTDAISRAFEQLLKAGTYVITSDRVILNHESSHGAINTVKAISLMRSDDTRHMQYNLGVTPGEKILAVPEFPYDTLQMKLYDLTGLAPAVEHQHDKNNLVLDFTETAEKNPEGMAYFTQIFDSLKRETGLGSVAR